jgi:signal transduction histidine kinase
MTNLPPPRPARAPDDPGAGRHAETAEQFNELGQLAAGVGHHVINAFATIVSNAEILRLIPTSPRPIDPVAIAEGIIRTALDASTVARRLIDFSRTGTATGDGVVDLADLAAAVADDYRARGHQGVRYETELNDVPPIRGHAAQLVAMLGHLLDNAREAIAPAPQGGTITLRTGIDRRGWACLEVVDTGRGMTVREKERALEPFFTTKNGHLGVGLSIANGIWRRHHGTVELVTRPGEGSTLRLCVETPGSP